MSFIPELFSIFFSIVTFMFSTTFHYSFIMKFPTNSAYLYYVYIIIILNTIYLLGTDISISFYFFDYSFLKNSFSYLVEFLFYFIFIIFICSIKNYNKINNINNFEFLFIAFNCLHMCIFLLNVCNFFTLFILIEMLSIGLYVLASFNKRYLYSIEAGLKYFILGSFSSSLILIGIAFIYGFTGFFNFQDLYMLFLYNSFFLLNFYVTGIIAAFALLFLGFLFKLYSAPFHFWILDIYQGSPLSSLLLFSTIYIFTIIHLFAKLYFFIVIDFFFIFYYLYVFFSFSCIIFGILGALIQKKIRKLIAYSTITFVGYYLSAFIAFDLLTIEYALHYLLIYIFNLIGLFIFLLNTIINDKYFIDKLINLNTLHKSNHLLSFIVAVLLFSISGMPPFWGFIGKIGLANSLLIDNNILYLIFFMLLTLIGFFYYIRIIKIIYFNTTSKWVLYNSVEYAPALILVFLLMFNIFNFMFDNFFLSIVSFYSSSFLF